MISSSRIVNNNHNNNNNKSFDSISSQKRLIHHSDSIISYQIDNHSNSFSINHNHCSPATWLRQSNIENNQSMQDNMKELLQRLNQSSTNHHSNNVNNYYDYYYDDLETTTSRSIIHGLILVTIMISSLISFVCSKIRQCTVFVNLYEYEYCLKYYHYYSLMTIVSLISTFLIYFLHLISQCNIFCLNRKKYEFEIMFISFISCLFILSIFFYLTNTNILNETFTIVSIIFSSISNLLYLLRIVILIYEMIKLKKQSKRRCALLKRRLNFDLQNSFIVNQANNSNRFMDHSIINHTTMMTTTAPKIVSYVRNHSINNNNNNNNNQRSKTLSTSLSDDFDDDDVFIQ